jgi:Histidine kinase-like ATPase domain
VPVSIQCLYGSGAVDSAALADIERAHPVVIRAGQGRDNEHYAGPGLSPFCDRPLPSPPADCIRRSFDDVENLPAVRHDLSDRASRFGLSKGRIADLVIAVNELVSNALVHGLWLVNQLCDLVELRFGGNRTTFRVHLRLDGRPGAAALPGPRRRCLT